MVKKDPNAPKRALSAYMFYSAAVRAKTKAELGRDAGITDVAKAIGAKWGKLTDAQKGPYQKKAEADKKRALRERAKYEKSGAKAKWAKNNPSPKGKRKKDPNAPKRALSAYMFYSAAVRDKTKKELGRDAGITDVAKAIGAKWGKLNDKQKAPYQKKATADKARAAKQRAKYEKSAAYKRYAASA